MRSFLSSTVDAADSIALEDLINSLRTHLARLTNELEENKALVAELRNAQAKERASPARYSPPKADGSVRNELVALRHEVERFGKEVHRLGGIVEEGLDTRRRSRGEKTIRMEQAEAAKLASEIQGEKGQAEADITHVREDMERRQQIAATSMGRVPPTPGPSRPRQGVHSTEATKLIDDTVIQKPTRNVSYRSTPPPSDEEDHVAPTPTQSSKSRLKSRRSPRVEGPSSPFPSIREEDEGDFFAALDETERPAQPTSLPRAIRVQAAASPWPKKAKEISRKVSSGSEGSARSKLSAGNVPPQTVLARVIRELEADFAHYKA